jgi:hypothetical protein
MAVTTMPASSLKKSRGGRRYRGKAVSRPQPTAPISIVSASAVGSVLTITFNQSVVLTGTPAYTTDVAGATAVSAVRTAPTVINITFSAPIAAATVVNIPYEEPAVRNSGGGFVADSTFPV